MMRHLCAWVLDRAFAQAAAWQQTAAIQRVFVNLSAQEIVAPTLVDEIAQLAAAHAIDTTGVSFEISERLLEADLPTIRDHLLRIRALGFGVALDDFGAGNTALAWLQELPIEVLKLDRRFIATSDDPASQAIAAAVLQLALGIASLAEGVETPAQLAKLRELGCDFAQGYHIALPQPAYMLVERLAPSVEPCR